MKRTERLIGRFAAVLVLCLLLMMLSGCTIKFVLEGADSYIVMPDGRILNGSLNECEIMILVGHTGNKLKAPVTLEYEYEGLLMGGGDTEDIAAYLNCELGGDGYELAAGEDWFIITGSMPVYDFWTDLGISSLGPSFAPIVELEDIIGSMMYQALVDGIIYVENHLMEDGSTMDIEIEGELKDAGGSKVGTFILWMDAVNPI